ncbi:putative pleckstrin-like protein [Golovinomyces cichoracearum]|uniref:Putative pleckstrin-like protein n=1 Tax=Golovinomyces cichoracearum TaxID=62708 RepID=A0A420I7I9_9PEZI|nr:putative pleckstrin-like protein [Golovinomyces cichoracearum]
MIKHADFEDEMATEVIPVAQKYSRYRNVRRITPSLEPEIKPDVGKSSTVQNYTPGTRSIGRYRRLKIPKADSPPAAPVLPKLTHTDIAPEKSNKNDITVRRKLLPSNHEDGEKEKGFLSAAEEEYGTDTYYDKGYGLTDSHTFTANQSAEQEIRELEHTQPQIDATSSPQSQNFTKDNRFVGIFTKKDSKSTHHTPALSTRSKSSLENPSNGFIEEGGGGIVPQVDAPKSAVNAGERRVLVRFKQSSISLPVNPETTPGEIISSAGDVLGPILLSSSTILLESFTQLGLERRIRKYEHIRDLMNSWDRDTQNSLIIEQTTDAYEKELEAKFVPSEAPAGITVVIHHSQKSGKWNKRYVTLHSSGQMFIAKRAGAKSTDKDYQNICHLSDFDIYTSMSQRVQKNHNPPGKNFYAIKSQQKTTIFLSSQNFVHYFSTDEDVVGKNFYAAVQRWRSWFLANRKGDGITNSCTLKNRLGLGRTESQTARSNTVSAVSHQAKDENTNKVDRTESDLDIDGSHHDHTSRKYPPPLETPVEENCEFLSSSLLGHTYSERKRELIEEILNRQRSPTASTTGTNKDTRALLDFTSSPTEPPQWSRGKGHGIRHIDGVPLIDIAYNSKLSSPPVSAQIQHSNTLLDRKDSKMSQRSDHHKLNSAEGPFVEGGLITALITNIEASNVGASVKYKSLAATMDKRCQN